MVQCIEMWMCRSWTNDKEEEKCPISNRVFDRMTDWGSLLSNLCLSTTRETIYNCVLFPSLFPSLSLSLLIWSDIEHIRRWREVASPSASQLPSTFRSFPFAFLEVNFSHTRVVWQQESYFNNTFCFSFLLLLFPYNYPLASLQLDRYLLPLAY